MQKVQQCNMCGAQGYHDCPIGAIPLWGKPKHPSSEIWDKQKQLEADNDILHRRLYDVQCQLEQQDTVNNMMKDLIIKVRDNHAERLEKLESKKPESEKEGKREKCRYPSCAPGIKKNSETITKDGGCFFYKDYNFPYCPDCGNKND